MPSDSSLKSWGGGVLIAGAVLLSMDACAPVGKMTHDMDAMIQSATTKADHEALAMHYEQEAKTLKAKAAEHQKMAQAYDKSPLGKVKGSLLEHCDTLASEYQRAAEVNLELARQHRRLAEEAPK